MGGTIKNEREKLDGQLIWLERWIVFAGFAVAVGVAIEIGPKVLKDQIDNEVIGGAIVILGVAVEVLLTFVAAQKTSRVQQLANSDVAQANERAAQALDRAAEANLEAETLRSRFAWRALSKEIAAKLTSDLKRKSSATVCVEYMNSDPESLQYAKQFRDVFALAGWKVWLIGATTQDLVFGVVLSRPDLADNAADQFIMETFQRNAFDFTTAQLPVSGSEIFTPSNPLPDPKAARVFIGPKWPDIEVSQ
jgi:hypothetical protein